MYVRIARFEGGERNWDEFAAGIRDTIRSGGQGTPFGSVNDAVTRMMLLVDREGNHGANLVLCETEDDLRRVDAALNEVTPVSGRGARTSVEMYEVLLDEKPGPWRLAALTPIGVDAPAQKADGGRECKRGLGAGFRASAWGALSRCFGRPGLGARSKSLARAYAILPELTHPLVGERACGVAVECGHFRSIAELRRWAKRFSGGYGVGGAPGAGRHAAGCSSASALEVTWTSVSPPDVRRYRTWRLTRWRVTSPAWVSTDSCWETPPPVTPSSPASSLVERGESRASSTAARLRPSSLARASGGARASWSQSMPTPRAG